jgi:hypothetical protein
MDLKVRHHPLQSAPADGIDRSVPTQGAFSFGMLLCKNVAFESFRPNELARARPFEALGGGAIGFDFGHYRFLHRLKFSGPANIHTPQHGHPVFRRPREPVREHSLRTTPRKIGHKGDSLFAISKRVNQLW